MVLLTQITGIAILEISNMENPINLQSIVKKFQAIRMVSLQTNCNLNFLYKGMVHLVETITFLLAQVYKRL
jgi:hypothetical protein